MPTYYKNDKIVSLFLFNHVISIFSVPKDIATNRVKHFHNYIMYELTAKLGLQHDSSTPYYSQANGQVEAINKVLKIMLQCMVGIHKKNWPITIFSTLWAYRTSVQIATWFTPFQLVYGLEVVLPTKCENLSLKLVVKLLPATSAK